MGHGSEGYPIRSTRKTSGLIDESTWYSGKSPWASDETFGVEIATCPAVNNNANVKAITGTGVFTIE
jgi:hypothetical protein